MNSSLRYWSLISIVLASAAIPFSALAEDPQTDSTRTTAPEAAAAPAPTDPQIAAVVVTANQVGVDAGKLAERNSKSKEVKNFAKMMVKDHSAAKKEATDLARKVGIKPETSDTSKSLSEGGKDNLSNLKKLKGAEFDKAYVDNEVAYHQSVLDEIDKSLIPNAKNAELKSLLEKSRPAFEAHLAHAKSLQAKLSG